MEHFDVAEMVVLWDTTAKVRRMEPLLLPEIILTAEEHREFSNLVTLKTAKLSSSAI